MAYLRINTGELKLGYETFRAESRLSRPVSKFVVCVQ